MILQYQNLTKQRTKFGNTLIAQLSYFLNSQKSVNRKSPKVRNDVLKITL